MMASPDNEKEWNAQRDLETLIEAEKIKQDKDRLKAAMGRKKKLKKALEGLDDKGNKSGS